MGTVWVLHLHKMPRWHGLRPANDDHARRVVGVNMETTAQADLLAALRALMALDVKGHTLADRLQFSDSGRALLDQCRAAIEKATK